MERYSEEDTMLIEAGRKDFGRFKLKAVKSNVPNNFIDASRLISVSSLCQLEDVDKAFLLFGYQFDDSRLAIRAIRYAEVTSQVKVLELEDADDEGPMVPREDIESVHYSLDTVLVSGELNNQVGREIRYIVEDCFRDINNVMRINYLVGELQDENPIIN